MAQTKKTERTVLIKKIETHIYRDDKGIETRNTVTKNYEDKTKASAAVKAAPTKQTTKTTVPGKPTSATAKPAQKTTPKATPRKPAAARSCAKPAQRSAPKAQAKAIAKPSPADRLAKVTPKPAPRPKRGGNNGGRRK